MINGWAHAYVESGPPELNYFSQADATQSSTFFPAAAYAAGATSAALQGPGRYEAISDGSFVFRVDQCVEFVFDATLIPSETDPQAFALIQLQPWGIGVQRPPYYQILVGGSLSATFRLSPGRYKMSAVSGNVLDSAEFYGGPIYEYMLFANVCSNPLIATQPVGAVVPVGGTAVLSITPSAPRSLVSFQWMRNGELLIDDERISGATTTTLSIHQVAYADSGDYDVVVTDDSITEYSSLAQLTVGEAQGIAEPAGSSASLRLGAAAPNPFRTSTALDYSAPAATPVTISIYDAAGRSVRQLGEKILSGPGSIFWDGRTVSGARAPAGTYFLRLVPRQGPDEVRRITLVR